MHGPMRADMARQPDVIAALDARAAEFALAGARLRGGRLFVAGCGDGAFAAEAAGGVARGLGVDWRAVGALDLLLEAPRLTPADSVIAISMSGNVDRTVEAAQAALASGARVLALVNGAGGRLGGIAPHVVSLDLPDIAPFLCGTTSHTATIAVLMLLAAGAAGRELRLGAALPAVSAALRLDAHEAPPSGVRFLAAGAELGTARYGAAKLVELTRIPAWSADLEEFAHSQYWATPTTDLVVVLATNQRVASLATASLAALAELGLRSLAIDTEATPVPSATRRLTLPPIAPELAPLASAIPLQALAHGLARAGGLDPDTRAHLRQDVARFRVSRLLTRRSLLGTGH